MALWHGMNSTKTVVNLSFCFFLTHAQNLYIPLLVSTSFIFVLPCYTKKMSERTFASKYAGKCKVCLKQFPKGTVVTWESGKGARHPDCLRSQQIDPTTGKSYAELAEEWDLAHENDLTTCERFDRMAGYSDAEPEASNMYRGVDEDTLWKYAREDTPRNPYR